jgi:hypothetical protein
METYPVKFLFDAYNVLAGQGYDAFRKFVNRAEMPTEDIERVLNKFQYRTNPEFKAKIKKMVKDIAAKLNGSDLEFKTPF